MCAVIWHWPINRMNLEDSNTLSIVHYQTMKCNSIQFYPFLSDQMTNEIEFIAFIVCQPAYTVLLYQLIFQCVTV